MRILYLHDCHSAPDGVQPTYLADDGHEVVSPALDEDDFAEAVRTAQAEFDRQRPGVVVGFGRGGAVTMNIDSRDTPLVLLCPAWKRWGAARTVKLDTVILHSRADDVVPFADSEELVRSSGLPVYALIKVGDDHRLDDRESLELLLEACFPGGEQGLLERDWTGLCYLAAIEWASTAEDRDWAVVHGTVFSDRVGGWTGHAWCERGEVIVDLAMPVGVRVIERELYYQLLQPVVSRVYSSDEALLLSLKNGHEGPWDESEQLTG